MSLSFSDIAINLTLSSRSLRKGYARIMAKWDIPPLAYGCSVANQEISVEQIDLDNCKFDSGWTTIHKHVASYRRHYTLMKMGPYSAYNVTLSVTTRNKTYIVWKTLRTVETGTFHDDCHLLCNIICCTRI